MGAWNGFFVIWEDLKGRFRNAFSKKAWRLLKPAQGLWLDHAPRHASAELANALRDLDADRMVAWLGTDSRAYAVRGHRLYRAYVLEYLLATLDPSAITTLPYPECLPNEPPVVAVRSSRRPRRRP